MFNTVTEDSVNYAINKLESFARVNVQKSEDEKIESLSLLCAAVGLHTDAIAALVKALRERYDNDASHYMFVGVLLGLGMAEHVVEHG